MRELAVGDTLDGYELQALLAQGGMATVYKAVERDSGRTVALKIPHLQYELDVVFYERFRREEEAARRLDHPNVVKALAPTVEKSRVYMVMEYVDGAPLSARLEEGRPLPAAEAVDIARQTCDALAYLHAHGVIHRDVKPGNILLTADGRVKLLDFGIAHMEAARRLTIAGLSLSYGTPDYMAPEQMRGRGGDARADLYALGTVLYQMLTGRLPYEGADLEALMRSKRLDDPPPPSVHVPGIDPSLEAIVMNALAVDPRDRYPTAVDMLADLRQPAAVVRRGRAAARAPRHRRDLNPLAACAAILVALSLIGWIAWFSHRRPIALPATVAERASATHERGEIMRNARSDPGGPP